MVPELHRPICDLLGCEYPVVLAGMGGVARSDLVAAVTEAGGFGFLGMVREPVSLIKTEVARVRARTDRDFGVNLIPAATDPALLDAQISACIALDVPVICLFWDISIAAIRRLRDAGIIVVCQVGTPGEAHDAQAAGAHALIAQGREAGGHVRGLTPRDVLLREVLAHVDIPVLAAGGIANGADLARTLAAGGDGVVMGTAFLATQESFAHDYHKQRIVDAAADDTLLTDIFHINWPMGARVRVLKNSVTEGRRGDPFGDSRIPIGEEEGRPIYLFSTDSPLKSMTGDFEAMALFAGEAAGMITDVPLAGERMRAIVTGATAIMTRDERPARQELAAELASPACWAREAADTYMGFASSAEITALLTTLAAAKRASARVLLRAAIENHDRTSHPMLAALYQAEITWRRMLEGYLRESGAPVPPIAPVYRAAMRTASINVRLDLLRRSQRALFAGYEALLPKIRDDRLHADLKSMFGSTW